MSATIHQAPRTTHAVNSRFARLQAKNCRQNTYFTNKARNIHAPFQAKMAEKAHGYCVPCFQIFSFSIHNIFVTKHEWLWSAHDGHCINFYRIRGITARFCPESEHALATMQLVGLPVKGGNRAQGTRDWPQRLNA
ncbi:MAG: hypothetical protein ACRCV9_09910 [Burkholderiaceae bacterium]